MRGKEDTAGYAWPYGVARESKVNPSRGCWRKVCSKEGVKCSEVLCGRLGVASVKNSAGCQ